MNSASNWHPAASPGHIPGRLSRASYTDRGKKRERNEDSCALPFSGADEAGFGTLLVLADGTGGLPGGEQASQEAVYYLQALYYATTGPRHPSDRLRQSVQGVNALSRLAQRQLGLDRGRLTTLVAAVIFAEHIWVANVGDSRAYLVQAGARKIQQLTEDHSLEVRAAKSGNENSPETADRQPGVITRAIGLEDECQVDTYHYNWNPGDRLLLSSDGLTGLTADEILSTVLDYPPEVAAKRLVSHSVEVDGQDNCTAVIAAWLEAAADPVNTLEDTQDITIQARSKKLVSTRPLRLRTERQARKATQSFKALFLRKDSLWLLFIGLLLGWLSVTLILILLLASGELSKVF
ncbi:MAG: PP2C family protein-serine/threonine phosphatase [Omnitrophica WOR_2 bacterium]